MSYIRLSNETFFDKDYWTTFVHQEEYKFVNIGDGESTLVPFYRELLRQVLSDKVDEAFKDYQLSKNDTKEIQTLFENKIEDTLPERENDENTVPNRQMIFKGVSYDLDLGITCPINRRIWDFFSIVKICEECFNENKPMYLSIE